MAQEVETKNDNILCRVSNSNSIRYCCHVESLTSMNWWVVL